jgi:hypothetical protein
MKRFLLLSFLVLIISCKTDNKNKQDSDSEKTSVSLKNAHELLKASIANAYNIEKFKAENSLRYNVKFSLADTLYLENTLIYNIVDNKLYTRKNSAKTEIDLSSANVEGKVLYLLNDIYTLPFNLKNGELEKINSSDSLQTSLFYSEAKGLDFKLVTHPITDIIQSIDVKTNDAEMPLHNTTVNFKKYITVNRIPVSMLWEITKNEEFIGQIKISRISYPQL